MPPARSQFLTTPLIDVSTVVTKPRRFLPDRTIRIATLQGELRYWSERLGREVIAPAGFQSDGASVPKLAWSLFPPFGRYLESAILHDWYYRLGAYGVSPISSYRATEIFSEAMATQGVGALSRSTMCGMVDLFGVQFNGNHSVRMVELMRDPRYLTFKLDYRG